LIPFDEPYFLSVCVPIKVDRNGVRWSNELWAKDLALHLQYLNDLTLACPRIFAEPSSFDRPLNVAPFDRLKFVDLPNPKNYIEAISSLHEMIYKMWKGIKSAEIVHTGFGGWPISEGWLAVPIGRLQRKFIITNVESSPWRTRGRDAKWRQRLRRFISERVNRWCVKAADLRLFTSKAYLEEFLGRAEGVAERAFVSPATWIDDANIQSEDQADDDWNKKFGDVRLLFAGRLVADKGLSVLLDAAGLIANQITVHITIIGEGPLAVECRDFVRQNEGSSLKFELLDPVQYGTAFFNLLRRFDAVIVPSLSDEQPRLIFDAFSQGIPVLGSDTGGITEIVKDDVNGKLFKSGDALSLAETLKWASQNRNSLRMLGISALRLSRLFTHQSMHGRRSEIIWAARYKKAQKTTV
jgi:glycosyltransferase involved in cell wall biosynthesis